MHACLALLSSSCKCGNKGVGDISQCIAGLGGKLLLAELVLGDKLVLLGELVLRNKLSLLSKLVLVLRTELCLELVVLRELSLDKLLSILNKLLPILNKLLSILSKLLAILQELLSILYEVVPTWVELTCQCLNNWASILSQLIWDILNELTRVGLELVEV